MSIICGIDPSFSRTGLCVVEDSAKSIKYGSVSAKTTGVYDLSVLFPVAQDLAIKVVDEISSLCGGREPQIICQEYPVAASRPGSILFVLSAYLWREIKLRFPNCTYYYVPAMAVCSLTGTKGKSKSELVKWVQLSTRSAEKVNHDESTAFVLALIGNRIKKKSYKNSYYQL